MRIFLLRKSDVRTSCICYSIFVEESFVYEQHFRAEYLVVQEPVTKFFPCKVIIWLQSTYILDVKGIQTEVMHCSLHCCLGSTKSTGNSSDASCRTVLYHF
jgi:hypothetical protein